MKVVKTLALISMVIISSSAWGQSLVSKMAGQKQLTRTMEEGALISASSAKGSPGYHRHLVRPGNATTYEIRLYNSEPQEVTVDLSITEPAVGWSAKLERTSVKLGPGRSAYVKLAFSASDKLRAGTPGSVTVSARTSSGRTGEVTLEAETTAKRKVYYVSIDSFGPEYLALNSKGNGLGKDGDWLTPNLHELIKQGTYFPNHKSHLVAATDMNHASMLSGAYPGKLGIYSVNVFLFGFDKMGLPLIRTTPLDIMYYGKEGKPVTNIFNVVKDESLGGNKNAFTAYVSGKAWVPQHYQNPVFGLDRVATVKEYPDYVTPPRETGKGNQITQTLSIQFRKFRDSEAFLWEDPYTIDQAIEVINNEDPDVCYILLGGVDAAGHVYGAAWDLEEWDAGKSPDDLKDDVSKVNSRANREGQIKIVKMADQQLGRFVNFLKERGSYGDAILVVESDHNMETNAFAGPKLDKILGKVGYSPKKDYFVFTVSQIGALFARPGRDNPAMIAELEKALEDYRMKNPVTGKTQRPMIVLNREEMKTGIDKATGERITPAMENYSEFYIEHPQAGNLMWPDLILLSAANFQFPLYGVGLASIGLGKLEIPLPKINIFVGGHGGQSTQPSLLVMHGPGIPEGKVSRENSWSSDLAPTIYALEGYRAPECVDGRVLPIGN